MNIGVYGEPHHKKESYEVSLLCLEVEAKKVLVDRWEQTMKSFARPRADYITMLLVIFTS